jgi:predicted nucleotidyltransferase
MNLHKGIENIIIETLIPFDVERIILFGSFVYGVPDKESDIDILVIKSVKEEETRKTRLQLKKELWNKLFEYNLPFDLVVDDPKRIKKRIEMGDLFYKEILNKGKTIYA